MGPVADGGSLLSWVEWPVGSELEWLKTMLLPFELGEGKAVRGSCEGLESGGRGLRAGWGFS